MKIFIINWKMQLSLKEEIGSFVPSLYKRSEEGSVFQGKVTPVQNSPENHEDRSTAKEKVIMETNPLTGKDRPVGLPKITRSYVREARE